ncbi:hypothetical protein [Pseudonocardia pini]|uniref:hypothetical protein n=1 Tax=Pseudonocardia pini TaxID=2758030 RepID=UPI0015F0A83A|nr:hypothetical protein [Pseudonocardia pini]
MSGVLDDGGPVAQDEDGGGPRVVTDLVLSGSTVRFPRIRWIVSHAGAALPVLAERVRWVSRLSTVYRYVLRGHAETLFPRVAPR